MGLIVQTTLDSGITVNNSYVRIDNFSGTKEEVTIDVKFYADKQSQREGKPYVQSTFYSFSYDINNAQNLLQQAYSMIKGLPEFLNATDDLED